MCTSPNGFQKIGHWLAYACIWLIAGSLLYEPAFAQQTRPLKGFVRTFKMHKPVPFAEVGIHGLTFQKASKQGDFTLSVPAEVKVGYVVTFEVTGWITMQPAYNGIYGSTPLPAPDAGDTILLVVKPGDKTALLADKNIETLLLGATYNFRKLADLKQSSLLSKDELTPVGWSEHVNSHSNSFQRKSIAETYFSQWLGEISEEIGISQLEVESAIASWIDRSSSDFDQGLGLMYKGDIEDAIARLQLAAERTGETMQSYVATDQALGFAYALQRNYSAAEQILRNGFDMTSGLDYNFLLHLGHVLTLDNKPKEAQRAFVQARQIIEMNAGISPNNEESPWVTPKRPVKRSRSSPPPSIKGHWEGDIVHDRFCLDILSQEQSSSGTTDEIACRYNYACGSMLEESCHGTVEPSGSIEIELNDRVDSRITGSLNPGATRMQVTLESSNDGMQTPSMQDFTLYHARSANDARNHMGERTVVCGTVVDVQIGPDESPLLYLDRPYPDEVFAIGFSIIDTKIFRRRDILLKQNVCVEGTITKGFRGVAQIVVEGISNVRVVGSSQ